ncbi:hypothetical protein BC830DRAFT_1088629 [Chytriomyces sp. MP71]|nr:hypothetical protein BC830DRAFT_1088629 [Chytriomyces sp. MP71]
MHAGPLPMLVIHVLLPLIIFSCIFNVMAARPAHHRNGQGPTGRSVRGLADESMRVTPASTMNSFSLPTVLSSPTAYVAECV